ncbi:TIGR02281 family clan AA aspartic protease [Fulvimarina sp. MAC3]|uniref:retropepsin-like aspartic protease family protein n=1 Tax=Fulvimarina sp. MAC3 TaxID=3148887 RepID=UPI0031FCFBA7
MSRAIFLLTLCSLGGLAVPSVLQSYLDKQRSGPERVEPATPVLDAAIQTAPADAHSGSFRSSVVLNADLMGHFRTDARLNGMRNPILIDTGATQVAIDEKTARQIGIYVKPSDWTVPVQTANGVAKGASARIDRVEIGTIVVRDVDALVLEEGTLGVTLVGMSFLSQLDRFSVEDGRLTMER